MSDDNEKPDLKARLGRKRLGRTGSVKNLEQESGASMDSYRGSAPSGEMPAVTPQAPGSFPPASAPSAPQQEVSFGAPAPVAAQPAPLPEFNFDPNMGKKTKMVTIIVAIAVGLPAFGIGYCGGHRIEQNKLANMATKDSKNIIIDLGEVNKSYSQVSALFTSPPEKLSEWVTKFPQTTIKTPDLLLLGKAKLNYIPLPRQRKQFMNDLISYYSAILLFNQYYIDFTSYIDTNLKPMSDLLKLIDAAPGKTLMEKMNSFLRTTSKDRQAKLTSTKGAKFIVLIDGHVRRSYILPFDPSLKVCPEDPVNCTCDGKNCKPKCEAKCGEHLKIYKYDSKEFSFSPVKKDLDFKDARVAIPLESIGKHPIGEIIQWEIKLPLEHFVGIAAQKFANLSKLSKQLEGFMKNVFTTIEDASKRKTRGFF